MIECTYIPVLQDCVSVEGQALPLQELCLMIIGFLVCVEVPHPLQLLQALHVYLQLIGQHWELHLCVCVKSYGHLPPQDSVSVLLRLRERKPPPQDRVQELHEVQLLTLQWVGEHLRLLRRLQEYEGVKIKAIKRTARLTEYVCTIVAK